MTAVAISIFIGALVFIALGLKSHKEDDSDPHNRPEV